MRKIVAFAMLAGAGAGLYLWLHAGKAAIDDGRGDRKDRPVLVSLAQATRRDVPLYLDGIGTVQAYNTVTARSRVDGQLVEVAFTEGQDVRAGDVLARIDPRIYKAQLDQATAVRDKDAAQLDNARRDLHRYQSLGDRVTAQSVDAQKALVQQLEAAVRADQAQADNAAVTLSYTTITAPIDGRTGFRLVDAGNIVHASDPGGLVTLTQMQPISVVFTLPQQSLQAALAAEKGAGGAPVVIAVQPDSRTEIDRGALALVDNQIDAATGSFKLKAVMPNARRQLWPGGFVTVRLLLSVRRNGLVIPSAAVQRGPQGVYAFVIRDDKTAEVRPITIAAEEEGFTLIDDGLKAGESVVVDGSLKLKAGSRVADAAATTTTTGGRSRGRDEGGETRGRKETQ